MDFLASSWLAKKAASSLLADSLNVSAATTILVYEAVRQRIAAGIDHVPAYVPWHGEGTHDH